MLFFILKFNTIPTLCGKKKSYDYVGHALWINLSGPILMPVGAVLLFIEFQNDLTCRMKA